MPNLLQNKKLIGEEISWLADIRRSGADNFVMPTPKLESFKYTKLFDLKADDFVMQADSNYKDVNSKLDLKAYKLYFENGIFNPCISELPQGVEVLPVIDEIIQNDDIKNKLCQIADAKNHPFVTLNNAYLQEGVVIKIEKNINLKKPIAIINHTQVGEENLFFNIHNLIMLEEGSSAEVIEYSCFDGDVKSRYFANFVNEIYIAKNAKLTHYKLQDEAYKAVHIANNFAVVEQNGLYKNFCLQKGANIGRNEINVKLLAQNATADINSIYKMSGWATLDTTTNVEHLHPQTFSNTYVKGVVDGEARGVFQGKVHIAKDAVKTEGKQLHRALLLSDSAEIDCKPELEIFADDVKCSHGASSGELDANQLFYMRSRGIDEDTARQILVEAFLNDIIYKVENEEIREWLISNV